MNSILRNTTIALSLLAFAGCGAATQNIPVSTNPSGATIFVDGKETCISPCNPALDKTQAHIITIQKEGYQQADVQIKQVYDTAGVARDATQSGMQAASTGATTEGAIANALLSTSYDESSGQAYVLSPNTITVKLAPVGQAASTHEAANAASDAPITISSTQLAPEDQKNLITTTEPTTLGSTLEDNPEQVAEAMLEAGAAAAPTLHTDKEWKSSHSSTSTGNDGSFNKTTTSSKVSVGASVNPVEAGLGVLHLLEDADGKNSEDTP